MATFDIKNLFLRVFGKCEFGGFPKNLKICKNGSPQKVNLFETSEIYDFERQSMMLKVNSSY